MAEESGSNQNLAKERSSSLPSPDAPRAMGPGPLIVLLAEDNLPDALLVREAIKLEGLPLELHVVSDGEQAIEFMAKAETDPDAPRPKVLLLDLNLPKIDGMEVLRRIRARDKFKNIPAVVVTSSDSPADRAEAARLHAAYFRKPVRYGDFIKMGGFLLEFLKANGLL